MYDLGVSRSHHLWKDVVDVAMRVTTAFAQFRREHVDLDANEVVKARGSRDYLQKQIASLATTNSVFPRLDTNSSAIVASGSFARHTKIQPLDDIDFFVVLDSADFGLRPSCWDSYRYYLTPKQGTSGPLAMLTDDNEHISSTRVLNLFKKALASVPNYVSADIHRNGEAVSLKLTSYPWVFDVVPAIAHHGWWLGRLDWYLMPNGQGDWMRSDPRWDAENATSANQRHDGLLLPLVRLVKYWNTKRLRQGLSSYYVETLCLQVFKSRSAITTLPEGLETFFRKAGSLVRVRCPDPKDLGPRLDRDIDRRTKESVERALREAARAARDARRAERAEDIANSLEAWQRIFGPEFPRFGR